MKYIIKNCPAIQNLMEWTGEFDNNENPIMTLDIADYCIKNKCECVNVDNCLIKQIVNKCDLNVSKVLYEGKSLKFIECNELASEILKLFDLWECENE